MIFKFLKLIVSLLLIAFIAILISETEGNLPTIRVDLIDQTISKLAALKSYLPGSSYLTQRDANVLIIDAIVDADGRVQSIEDLDIDNLSPVEALLKLNQIKKEIKDGD